VAVNFLAGFFIFGACMSGLAAVTLCWPGTWLDRMWAINPEGHAGLLAAGRLAAMGMAVLSAFMLATACGLVARRQWARTCAAAILTLNAFGDVVSAIGRSDPRSLIGVLIAAVLVWWLARPHVRAQFH
jgi:hypothetical protein